jgi:3-isopropylmalate/(R)-2-methylmalate dehydratase small subunit
MSMTRADLSRMLFAGLRYDKQDRELPDFILNREPFRRACFLIGGVNFGCGSSRDTAPKMLSAFGIRCVIAPSYGAIFYDNCFKSGMLPMILDEATVGALAAEAEGGGDFALDLESKTLTTPAGRSLNFDVPSFRREQLLVGADDIELTLRRASEIAEYQRRERAMRPWTFLG